MILKVRCLNNAHLEDSLEVGKEYEVVKQNDSYYWIQAKPNARVIADKRRFEIVQ